MVMTVDRYIKQEKSPIREEDPYGNDYMADIETQLQESYKRSALQFTPQPGISTLWKKQKKTFYPHFLPDHLTILL